MEIERQQGEIEITLRGIRLAIQYKSFLLSLDIQSRRNVLYYCTRWFELEQVKDEQKEINSKLYVWFQNAHGIYMNDDNESKKRQITSEFIWDDLYINLSKSLAFQKLCGFFLNGTLPQSDLR